VGGWKNYIWLLLLKLFTTPLPNSTPLEVLQFIVNNNNFVPNVAVALRIILTMPVSVTSGERSFSKLKIIKNYLRPSMNQERLSDLATISIEKEVM
jgi:hypothetical protein